jgi:hypothetical protein
MNQEQAISGNSRDEGEVIPMITREKKERKRERKKHLNY